MLKEGDKAPDFRVTADDGSTDFARGLPRPESDPLFLSEGEHDRLHARSVEFRDAIENFRRRTPPSSAVSGGLRRRRRRSSRRKYKLNFPLLADTEFEVIEAYGARRMKSFLRKIVSGHRAQHLLDRAGR